MKYFVTGGTGFIGRHLVARLQGEVTVYARSWKELPPGTSFVQGDILDGERVAQAMAGHDWVFHLAANPNTRDGFRRTDLDLMSGTIGTYNVLEAMRANKIRRIVFTSSGTVYGETAFFPLPEDHGPFMPISLYGASKLASEALISAYCHLFDTRGWIFRLANIVGAGMTHGAIPNFIEQLSNNPEELAVLGDGTQEKPYLLVEECAGGMFFALEHARGQLNIFNLGPDTTTSLPTVAQTVIEGMGLQGVKIRYRGGDRGWPGDVPRARYSVERLASLGWRAKLTSDQAIRRAVQAILVERAEVDSNCPAVRTVGSSS